MNRDQSERLIELVVETNQQIHGVRFRMLEVIEAMDRVAAAIHRSRQPWWRRWWPR